MSLVRVEVTAEDIAAGTKGQCTACPVALAVSRACGRPMLTGLRLIGEIDDHGFVWPPAQTPAEVKEWMQRFDWGQDAAPFSFDLDLDLPKRKEGGK